MKRNKSIKRNFIPIVTAQDHSQDQSANQWLHHQAYVAGDMREFADDAETLGNRR